MPRTIRFHLDEHVTHAVAGGLQRSGIDVTTTTDVGLLGAGDIEQLTFGLNERRVVFTEDDDFSVLTSRGASHAGLAYCKRNTRSIGYIVRALELLWEIYEPDEMINRVEFI